MRIRTESFDFPLVGSPDLGWSNCRIYLVYFWAPPQWRRELIWQAVQQFGTREP